MTTELTTRQRVEQAVMRQLVLIAEKEEALTLAGGFSAQVNQAKNRDIVERVTEAATAIKDASYSEAETICIREIERASKPLQRAQEQFDELERAAREALGRVALDGTEVWQAAVNEAQREYDLTLAAAEAEVHRAKAEVHALEETMSQHRDVVLNSLGIDLNALNIAS